MKDKVKNKSSIKLLHEKQQSGLFPSSLPPPKRTTTTKKGIHAVNDVSLLSLQFLITSPVSLAKLSPTVSSTYFSLLLFFTEIE